MNPSPQDQASTDSALCFLSAVELGAAYRARTLQPSEVTAAVLRQIERVNPAVNAFVTIVADQAMAAAEASDARFATGSVLGPLDGVPVGIKDLADTAGIRTTHGSYIYEHHVPDSDAPVVAKMKQAGAIILGKTNTPEFGWKSPTDNPSLARRVTHGIPSGRQPAPLAARPRRWPAAWGRLRRAVTAADRSGSLPVSAASLASSRPSAWCHSSRTGWCQASSPKVR